jgi:hypothetical protein
MEIKDYLHLYLGANCKYKRTMGISSWKGGVLDTTMFKSALDALRIVKPILRPLSDMTEEEFEIWDNGVTGKLRSGTHDLIEEEALKTHFLLSKHFDLFGLIDAGLAIDETPLPTNKEDAVK